MDTKEYVDLFRKAFDKIIVMAKKFQKSKLEEINLARLMDSHPAIKVPVTIECE